MYHVFVLFAIYMYTVQKREKIKKIKKREKKQRKEPHKKNVILNSRKSFRNAISNRRSKSSTVE